MHPKSLFVVFFCSIIAQNFAQASSELFVIDGLDEISETPCTTSNQSFRKTPPVTTLNHESFEEEPFFNLEDKAGNIDQTPFNRFGMYAAAVSAPLSNSFAEQNPHTNTPVTPKASPALTADELAALIASRSTPEETFRKLRRRSSSSLYPIENQQTPHGQS